jgi:hypothetical protein
VAASIVLILLYLVGGLLAASAWGAVLRTLGESLTPLFEWGRRHRAPVLSLTAFTVVLILQGYGALTFVALVVSLTRHFLAVYRDVFQWPFWVAACIVAEWPVLLLVKSASQAERHSPIHLLPMALLPVTLVAFPAFVFRQTLLEAGWWWLPYSVT